MVGEHREEVWGLGGASAGQGGWGLGAVRVGQGLGSWVSVGGGLGFTGRTRGSLGHCVLHPPSTQLAVQSGEGPLWAHLAPGSAGKPRSQGVVFLSAGPC